MVVTERKPRGASWESWIERQIDDGRKSGAFDNLDGHGKPIDSLDQPHDELWCVKAKLQREDVIVTPPTIAIRAERDRVLAEAMHAPDETTVRSMIADLNEQIRDVNRFATWGPPSSVAPLDVEPIIDRWRADGTPAPRPEHNVAPAAARPTIRERLISLLRRWRSKPSASQ